LEFGGKVVDRSTLWIARIERGLSDSEKKEFYSWLAERPENEA